MSLTLKKNFKKINTMNYTDINILRKWKLILR